MSNCSCSCKNECVILTIFIGIILGIIAGTLEFLGAITVTSAFLWTIFGITIGFLTISFAESGSYSRYESRICICSSLRAYITGIIGTLLASVILLEADFAEISIVRSVITGGLIGFFTLIIGCIICTIKSRAKCNIE